MELMIGTISFELIFLPSYATPKCKIRRKSRILNSVKIKKLVYILADLQLLSSQCSLDTIQLKNIVHKRTFYYLILLRHISQSYKSITSPQIRDVSQNNNIRFQIRIQGFATEKSDTH